MTTRPEALRLAEAIDPLTRYTLDNLTCSAAAAELRRLHAESAIAAHAKRLALELECLLLSCNDTAAVSKWWNSAHEALEAYQAEVDRVYPQPRVSAFGKD